MLSRLSDLHENPLPVEGVLRMLVMGRPQWFPLGVELTTDYQIPVLPSVQVDDLPTEMWGFDKAAAAIDRSRTLLHFYVGERKLRRLLQRPERFISQFEGVWGITSPDFSVWDEAPPQFRVMATWLNRALGCVYANHGIRVVPNLRWCDRQDYDHCFAGVAPGSVVAVSTHGLWRVGKLRHGFLMGLHEMVERLTPPAVILHGSVDRQVRRELGRRVELVHFASDRSRIRQAA